jgi:hygromycin-B 7''-O-kinase
VKNLIKAICQREGLDALNIIPVSGGQVNQVFRIDEEYVIRIGSREDAFQRLKHETELMRRIANDLPVPKILAFGQQDGLVYQIQQFVRGQKLYSIWKNIRPDVQDKIVAELASFLRTLHAMTFPDYGTPREDSRRFISWQEFLTDKFTHTLEELKDLKIRVVPGFIELASEYFEEHKPTLQEGAPVLVHGDLWLGNILVENARISAILDFEYAIHAPVDYELSKMEDFGLYPNDYIEEDSEIFCAADFASFFQLLQRHYPALFEIEHLRERMNLYHLVSALSDYLEWRKSNLSTIPAGSLAARHFYMARITNAIFRNGTRMF